MATLPTVGADTDTWGTELNEFLTQGPIVLTPTGANLALDVVDGATNNNSVRITASANKSASTSVGGALNITTTASGGAGLVIYSNFGAGATGRLLVIRADNAAFTQACVRIENDGNNSSISISSTHATATQPAIAISTAAGATGTSAHALSAVVTGSGSVTTSAGNFVSSNTAHSCVQITAVETDRGSLKITHTGSGTDANASAISIDLAGDGTACKGIFVTSTATGGSSGSLLDLRNGSAVFRAKVEGSGEIMLNAASSSFGTTNLWNGSINFWLDESANKLMFNVKYSTGATKTGEIALV